MLKLLTRQLLAQFLVVTISVSTVPVEFAWPAPDPDGSHHDALSPTYLPAGSPTGATARDATNPLNTGSSDGLPRASLQASSLPVVLGGISVSVGYADSLSPAANFPVPWQGAPNTFFIGGGANFNAGAIRLDNTTSSPITIDSVVVDLQRPGPTFNLWGSLTVPPQGSAILTQTSAFNFVTSGYPIVSCGAPIPAGDSRGPKITVTVSGNPNVFLDTAHVLDTGGFDLSCRGNRSLAWRPTGATGIESPSASLTLGPDGSITATGTPAMLTAQLTDAAGQPLANASVSLRVTSGPNVNATGQGVSDSQGRAQLGYTGNQAGSDQVQALLTNLTGSSLPSNPITVNWSGAGACPTPPATPSATSVIYLGQTSAHVGDTIQAAALLSDGNGTGLAARALVFAFLNQTVSATTDVNGVAQTTFSAGSAGPAALTVNFAGATGLQPASTSAAITISKENTLLRYTGATLLGTGVAQQVTAQLNDLHHGTALPNQTVSFQVGTATASAVTDASGAATASLTLSPSAANGPAQIQASFAGDVNYNPSSVVNPVNVFLFSNFVIWGGNSGGLRLGQEVNFWGSQWEDQVINGPFNTKGVPAFKGFAGTVVAPLGLCLPLAGSGQQTLDNHCWSSKPGDSSPPDTLPAYIGVIVATAVAKNGSEISGNIAALAVLKVNPSPVYGPEPGKPGFGQIVALISDGAQVFPTPVILNASQSQPATVLPGQTYNVSAVLTNNGQTEARTIAVSESFDGTTPASGTQTTNSLPAGQQFTATFSETAPTYPARQAGESSTDYEARLADADGRRFTSTGSVTFTDPISQPYLPVPLTSFSQLQMPRLKVSLSGPPCVNPGGTLPMLATVTNLGSAAATGIAAVVTLPGGATTALSVTNLAPGMSFAATVNFTAPALAPKSSGETTGAYLARLAAADGAFLTASIRANWQDAQGNSYGAVEQQFSSAQQRVPILTGGLTVPSTLLPGSTATVSFTVENTGGGNAIETDLQVTNPDGTVKNATPFSVAAGQSATASTTWPAPAAAKQSGENDAAYQARLTGLDNQALNFATSLSWKDAAGSLYGPTLSNGQSTRILPIVTVNLTGPASANSGTTISYNATIQNIGHAPAPATVLTILLPDGTTATPALAPPLPAQGLPPGGTAQATANFSIPVTTSGQIGATATVVWQDANGGAYGPLSSTASTTVTAPLQLTVSAGSNQSIPVPQNLLLEGSVTVTPSSAVTTVSWSQVSGPAAVDFSNPFSPASTVHIPSPGSYSLRLTAIATNGSAQLTQNAEVTITGTAGTAQPPVVSAGPDQTIQLPTSTVTLNGAVTHPTVPVSQLTISWSKLSGPGNVTFSSPTQPVTQATFAAAGAYVLKLSASDSQFTSSATVLVTVKPVSTVNQPPVVNAGATQSVTLRSDVSSLPLAPTVISIAANSNNTVGMDYHQPTNKIVMSVNFPNGSPFNFKLLSADGSTTQFSSISGLTDEVYIAAARDDGGGMSMGGFPAGTFFTGSGVAGVVVRVTPDGSAIQKPWVTLPGETGLLRGQLHIDRTGVFGGDLIVLTTAGNVWRVNSAGVPTRLANIPVGSPEGLVTVPNDPLKYGPWAGKILVGSELANGLVWAIDLLGNVTSYNIGVNAEHIKVIGRNESYFGVDFGLGAVVAIPAPELAGLTGDFLMGEEFTGSLFYVRWNGTSFETTKIYKGSSFEGATMALAGIAQVAATSATVALQGAVTDDGLPAGGQLTSSWTKVSGPGTATFSSPSSPATAVTFSEPGAYVLRLTANDSQLSASSDVTITILANRAPVVDAGTEQQNTFPGSVTLQGSVTDDGLPSGGQLSVFWTKVTGPGRVTFGAPTYSASDDFSPTSNPNGPWSYGWEPFRGGLFTPYPVAAPLSYGIPGWFRTATGQFPHLGYNNTGSTVNAGNVHVPAGMLALHPGPSGENSVLRWTAPNAGTFLVQGRFLGVDSVTTTDVGVLLNSATTLVSGNLLNLGSGVPFSFVRTLKAGDTLDFTVGFGNDGNFNNDSTGLTVTITQAGSASTPASFSLPGDYLLRLAAYDSELFGFAEVHARIAAVCAPPPSGLVGWWPGDGDTQDLVAANTGLAEGGLTYTNGMVGKAFALNGVDADVVLPATPALNVRSFTLDAWIFPRDLTAARPILEYANTATSTLGVHLWLNLNAAVNFTPGALFANVIDTSGGNHIFATGPAAVPLNQWSLVALTYDQATGVARIYVNGVAIAAGNLGAFTPQTSFPLNVGKRAFSSFANRFFGNMDEVEVYNRALAASEIQALYLADAAGKCKPAGLARPVVSAGLNQTITLPANSVTLSGTATDPQGRALVISWSQITGPGVVTFSNPASLATSAAFSAAGAYILRLTAANDQGAATSDVTITVNPTSTTQPPPAPVVNAGPGQMIQLPTNTVTLNGSVQNSGGGSLTIAWRQVSGPAAATFANSGQAVTPATFPAAGVYVLELSASTAQASASATTTVVVNPQALQPPVVNAGPSQTIQLPTNTVSLNGSASDPLGAALTIAWTQVSGPAPVTFSNPAQAVTVAAFSNTATGTYVLELRASNTQFTSAMTVSVTVVAANTPKQPPVVSAGPNLTVQLPATATLNGSASDPVGAPLTIAWSKVSGPGAVSFSAPSQPVTQATFSAAGTYVVQLSASNGQFTSAASATITVLAQQPPVVSAGAGQTIQLPTNTVTLNGSASDPQGIPLTIAWSKVSGPGTVSFSAPAQPVTQATFSAAGSYVLQLSASNPQFTVTATVTITVQVAAPVVSAGPNQSVQLPANTVTLNGSASDPGGLPLTLAWSQVSGPATATFSNPTQAVTQASFTTAGSYLLKLSASNGQFTSSSTVSVIVVAATATNQAPVVTAPASQTTQLPNAATIGVTLNGTAADDGLPVGGALVVGWSVASGVGAVAFSTPGQPVTQATFTTAGTYVLRLTASDSALTSSAQTTVVVNAPQNQPPVVTLPGAQTIQLPNNVVILNGAVTDDGLPVGGVLTVAWSKVSGPGTVAFGNSALASTTASFSAAGTYSLQLSASDSLLSTTATATVNVLPPPSPPPTVSLALADGTEITQPTPILATISNGSWKLESALFDDTATAQRFVTLAAGVGAVGTSTTPATLATLDPTLLLNGAYQLRLTASDAVGQLTTATSTVTVARSMKVGVFTLSFNDLTAPVAGLPIQVTRSYDSRDKRVGDFGIGWTLGLSNARLQKNRNLGLSWSEDLQYSGFLPQFCLQPTSARIVTATFPDGKVYKFQAARQCQAVVAITNPTVTFQQLPGTAGTAGATLAPLDGGSALIDGGVPGVVNLIGFDGLPYNPTVFRLTTAQGFSYVMDQKLGVTSLTDPNGNTLTIGAGGVLSSSGPSVTFARDAQGRITTITDPAGKAMTYAYNAGGDLASFTDRQGNTTSFAYAAGDFLTTITTPNGVVAINNSYDASGRLQSSLDALNATLSYNHDLANRRETITDRLGNSTTYVYDSNGNILETTDALGNVTTATYDASDNKLTETNALGQTTRFAYDVLGNLVSQADPLGNTTRYSYNPLQQPLTVTDPLGRVTTNTYDSHGNLTSTKDPLGNTTTNVSNTRGLVTSTTDAAGKTTTFSYDAAGNLLTQTDALGTVTTSTYDANGNRLTQSATRTLPGGGSQTLVTSFTYDNLGRLTRTTQPDGSSTQTIYNSLGQVSATIDALNRQTTFVYDNNGRLTQTTYPDATTDSTVYDAEGRRIKTTNRGIVTQFAYDRLGRLTQTTFADNSTTGTGYDAAGQVISTTDARGNVTRYAYDGAGRRTQVSNALNQATVFTYDAAGNQLTARDARGNTTAYTYDAANRRTKVTFPDGKFESTAYDALGRVVSRTDAAGKTTQFGYDALGRLATVTDALNQVTSYTYDEVGNRITQTDANLHTTSYGYDQRGRRSRRALPLGQSESYVYDAAGNLTARTDFNGKTTVHAYDSVNRLLSKTPDASFAAPQVKFTYTATGKRATMVDASGTTTYVYDLRDRLVSKATPAGTLTYAYDAASNLTALSTTGLTVNYNYDVLNRLATVSEAGTGTTSYGFDAAGNLTSFATPNGVAHAYTYDSRNRLTNLAVGNLASYAYTLDPAGHRTSVTELSGRTVNYTYDALYRLTSEAISGLGSVSYIYDPVGNRKQTTSTITQIPAGLFNYDANDRLSTDTYDANGNTLNSNSAYDFENHLVSQGSVRIVYDSDGNRVAKTAGGITTRYLVDDLNPTGFAQVIVELIANSAGEQRHYVYGLERLSQRRVFTLSGAPAETRFFGYDGHGSVRLLTDAAGAVTDTYDYDAFGNLLSSTGPTPNEFRFAGEQFDFDLSLYYNRARYLDVRTGRFWTMDPFEGDPQSPASLHRYLYANANPIDQRDPSGNETLGELVQGTAIYLRNVAFNARTAFAAGGAAIGSFFNALGQYAQNTARQVIRLFASNVEEIESVETDVEVIVQNSRRVIDFLIRTKGGARDLLIEAKYSLPLGGEALSRLVGQARNAVESGRAQQVVVWTLRPPSATQIRTVLTSLGDLASRVQFVDGVQGLYDYLTLYFR